MENPFEIILEKLSTIEKSVISIENQLKNNSTGLELMSTSEVAEYLNFTKGTVYGLVHQRKIPVIKKGKLYFSKQDIDNWLLEFKKPTTYELNEAADKYILKNKIFQY